MYAFVHQYLVNRWISLEKDSGLLYEFLVKPFRVLNINPLFSIYDKMNNLEREQKHFMKFKKTNRHKDWSSDL